MTDPSPDAFTARVYDELRSLAERYMGRERADHTLQPTALVHEAYLRVAGAGTPIVDRTHFMALGARTMRRILVDHARRTRAAKRGGGAEKVTLDLDRDGADPAVTYDLVELHDALEVLAGTHPRKARVIELRYFGGLEVQEIADHLGVSRRTVLYDTRAACAWLHAELTAEG